MEGSQSNTRAGFEKCFFDFALVVYGCYVQVIEDDRGPEHVMYKE